ncbi:MAG: tRNA lysidine(34) synthetase TilS [Anaerolineales bacterium]
MKLASQVAEVIEAHELLRPEELVILAVSGGADSLCLALVLRDLGYPIHIAHFDHGLRPESRQEADFVRDLAVEWQVPFTQERANPPMAGAGSQEAWARQARYRFLLRVATKVGAHRIATGHTADDQVETILMNLIRGAGPEGLAGMPFRGPVPIQDGKADEEQPTLIRPLLATWREQTEACCQQADLKPLVDPSNRDLKFTRNRIRHQLLPQIAELNPGVKGALLRTGWLMRSTSDWIDQEVEARWSEVVHAGHEQELRLDRHQFSKAPTVLEMSIFRRSFQAIAPADAEINFEHTLDSIELVKHGELGDSLSLPGDLLLEIEAGEALLRTAGAGARMAHVPQLASPKPLNLDGLTELEAGWRIASEQIQLSDELRARVEMGLEPYNSPRLEVMDLARVRGKLELRSRAPGDIFQPLGMAGSMKLADFFINEGIPEAQRARWPLLVNKGRILWVVGVRLSELASLRDGSEQVLKLELRSPEPTD